MEKETTAIEKFNEKKEEIVQLLDFFQLELNKKRTIDWETVGTIVKVREDLIQTLSFLSGFSENEIHNTLVESKL